MSDLAPYEMLPAAYTEGRLSSEEFSLLYVTLFKRDPVMRGGELFEVLQDVFSAADLYYADADPSKRFEVDEEELRATAIKRLEDLRRMRQ